MEINVTMSQEEFEQFLEFKKNESKEILLLKAERCESDKNLETLASLIFSSLKLCSNGKDVYVFDSDTAFRALEIATEFFI